MRIIIIVGAIVCGGILVMICIRLMQMYYEGRLTAYQNKLLQKQVDEVHSIYQTMRGWRHDYHNHLQTLKAKLALGQTEEAREYLNELESDLDAIRQISETGNIALDAVLNSKLSLVMEQGIRLSFKAQVPSELSITSIDLCVLLGNLIDNGVEACENLEASQRFLRLYLGIFKQQLYISVTNAAPETARGPDAHFVTGKKGNHGHGLKQIDRVVKKYGGYINRKQEPGVFATEVMLPL